MIVRTNAGLFACGKWLLHVVSKGDSYGLDGNLTHNEACPLVEFYDSATLFSNTSARGVLVSRHSLKTLIDHPKGEGLALSSHDPSKFITADELASALILVLHILSGKTSGEYDQ